MDPAVVERRSEGGCRCEREREKEGERGARAGGRGVLAAPQLGVVDPQPLAESVPGAEA